MAHHRALVRPVREVVYRCRPQTCSQIRYNSTDQKVNNVPPVNQEGVKSGPNESQLPHVTEEQAAMDKSMGQTPPDIGQGTPVQDMMKRDKSAQDNAPQVMKDQMKKSGQQTRSYSTSARRPAQLQEQSQENMMTINGMIKGMDYPDAGPGHKFPIPDLQQIGFLNHLKRRYDPVIDQVTKSLMQDGKLSVAQKNMAEILTILQTAPAPNANPAFPQRTLALSDTGSSSRLNPVSSPSQRAQSVSPIRASSLTQTTDATAITRIPRAALPLHPVEYLTTIIDSVSPLIKIRQQAGLAGGGKSLPIPVPLGVRQRRRQAIQWILSAAGNRREVKFSERVARELLRVADGTSGVWERRAMVHRLGVASRSNVSAALKAKMRKKIVK